MRKLFTLAAALALTACAGAFAPPVNLLPAAPAEAADATVLDEQAAIGVELSYKAFRSALELATDAGAIKGERAVRVAELDRKAYSAVRAARAAYQAGNSTSYSLAIEAARTAVAAAKSALETEAPQ